MKITELLKLIDAQDIEGSSFAVMQFADGSGKITDGMPQENIILHWDNENQMNEELSRAWKFYKGEYLFSGVLVNWEL